MALLKGKLSRKQENMEDILTSNVFGMLKYLPPQKALFPFLGKAATIDDDENHPLTELTGLGTEAMVNYQFWPRLEEEGCLFCEPDVLLEIGQCQPLVETGNCRPRHLVLIEAKYRSGKSSFAEEEREREADQPENAGEEERPKDQLAKEWCNVATLAGRKGPNCRAWLIYLTADFGCPRESIAESCRELQEKGFVSPMILWLSWRHLRRIVDGRKKESRICDDLAEMLRRMDLTFYEGISPRPSVPALDWSFTLVFQWDFVECGPIDWRPNRE